MDIGRDNYEIWFLDYLDGLLDEEGTRKLMSFLEFNPDLKDELDGIRTLKLEAGSLEFPMKSALRKSEGEADRGYMIDHFEDYCLAAVEKQLAPGEEKLLQEILEEEDEKRDLYNLYQSTRLKADQSILYPAKSRLKRRFLKRVDSTFWIPAAAAAAVLMLVLPWMFRNSHNPGILPQDEQLTELTPAPEGSVEIRDRTQSLDASLDKAREQTPVKASREKGKTPGEGTEYKTTAQKMGKNESAESFQKEIVKLARLEPLEARALDYPDGSNDRTIALLYSGKPGEDHGERQDLETGTPEETDRKLSFWNLADAGIRKLNQVTENRYTLARLTDDSGSLRRFTFESPNFGISTPARNPNRP